MQEEAAGKFDSGQGQGFDATSVGVIFIGEGNRAGVGVDGPQAGGADSDAVSVASQIIQDVVGSDDGAFGKNDPGAGGDLAQKCGESSGVLERQQVCVELKFAGGMELEQRGAELAREHFGHRLHWEEPACLFGSGPGILGGKSAAGDQTMQMGMIHQILAPGVKDGGEAQLGLKAYLAELQERGAGALKEQLVEGGQVLQNQRAQGRRQSEDPMEIAHGQKRTALALEPRPAALMLASRAMPVATAMRPPVGMAALLALPNRPAQFAGATPGQTAQHLEVRSRHRMTVKVFGQEYLDRHSVPAPHLKVLRDVKSTRLNSSHAALSHAVFCLHNI